MKLSIELDHQDISNATPEAFSCLFSALQNITAEKPATEVPQPAVKKTRSSKKVEKEEPVKEVKTETVEPAEPVKEETKQEEPVKGETKQEEPVKEVKTEPEKAETTEPDETPEPAKEEEPKQEKIDREEIVNKVKKIAFAGKAEGKPKKIKAILQQYGVDTLPALPDEKLPEFLEKVEAL